MTLRMDPVIERAVMFIVDLLLDLDSRFVLIDSRKMALAVLMFGGEYRWAVRVKKANNRAVWTASKEMVRALGPIARRYQPHPVPGVRPKGVGTVGVTRSGKIIDDLVHATEWVLEYESELCLNWVREDLILTRKKGRDVRLRRESLRREALKIAAEHMLWVLEYMEGRDENIKTKKSDYDVVIDSVMGRPLENNAKTEVAEANSPLGDGM